MGLRTAALSLVGKQPLLPWPKRLLWLLHLSLWRLQRSLRWQL